jgi:hypothetical protein
LAYRSSSRSTVIFDRMICGFALYEQLDRLSLRLAAAVLTLSE